MKQKSFQTQSFQAVMMCVCALAIYSPAYAWTEKACRVYEFAELNTFSDEELIKMKADYDTIYIQIGSTVTPINAREVQEDFADKKNCSDESARITRVLNSRTNKKSQKSRK